MTSSLVGPRPGTFAGPCFQMWGCVGSQIKREILDGNVLLNYETGDDEVSWNRLRTEEDDSSQPPLLTDSIRCLRETLTSTNSKHNTHYQPLENLEIL